MNSYTDASVTDRRSQARLTATELAMISYEENGTRVRQLANVEDISLNGAGMIVDRAVAVGTALTMTYGQGELAAVVRHCAPLGERHFIGIEFVGSSRESNWHFDLNCWFGRFDA